MCGLGYFEGRTKVARRSHEQLLKVAWSSRAPSFWRSFGPGFTCRFFCWFHTKNTLVRIIGLRPLVLTRDSFELRSHSFHFCFYFEAEGRVAALRAASRKSFGLSVQDINGLRPFISFRANGPKDHLRYRKMVRRTILLLRAYKVSIHGHFICDTLLLFW